MEEIILKTLLKTDEYTINEMCRSSTGIRKVCKEFKNPLAKHIIEQRVKNRVMTPFSNTIDLKRVLKEYKNYANMLVEWKKWGRSKHIRIVEPDLGYEDWLDVKKANKVLDKPENESFKKSLIRGDIVSINYREHRNEGKLIFDGKKLESLDSDQDEEGNVPKSYLVIDEFHIRYWEDTIGHNTFVPVILPEPKSITSSELGNSFFYTFEKNEKTFYLFLYSHNVPLIPKISFNKVNFFESNVMEEEYRPAEFANFFAKTNADNFFSLETE
jgi:hypothetical protein